jgi:tetratricopeptide (TPR) repeat protein
LAALGRFEEGQEYLRSALEIDGANLRAIELLEFASLKLGRDADVLEQFRKLTRLNAASPQSCIAASLASYNLRRLPEAEAQLKIALSLDPTSPEALKALAAILVEASRFAEALEPLQALLAQKPDDEEGLSLRGLVLDELGRHDEAAAQYREMLERAPGNAAMWSRLVQALALSGEIEAATEAAEDGIRTASNPALIYNTRGEIRRQTNEFEGALTDYSTAAGLDPSMVDPHFNAVTCLIALGRAGEIVACLDAGVEAYQHTNPKNLSGLITCLQENLVALFRHATESALANQLAQIAERLQAAGLLPQFEQALSLAMFALLRDHSSVEESRFRLIESKLGEALSSRLDTTVILRLLSAGVQYLKGKDNKALLSLTREERELLVKELGITS